MDGVIIRKESILINRNGDKGYDDDNDTCSV